MKKYLLNTNSKCIHLADSKDGRCKITTMRDEYKIFFDSLQEAKNYPTSQKPLARGCCSFCLSDENKRGND